jgi:glycosyltransferase involved in cell wall biosynthesis
MRELVSVIIPVYNRARCVGRAIDSVLAQTYGDVEIVVVDDGSTDETGALVQGVYGKDSRVRYVFQPNAGVSAARNHGIRLIRGEFAALLDSDDVWEPFKLEIQMACLRAFPDAGMVWSDMTAIRTDGREFSERFLTRRYSGYRFFSFDDLFDQSLPLREIVPDLGAVSGGALAFCGDVYAPIVLGNLVHTSTVLLRRERLTAAGFYDESVLAGEDYQFHVQICRAGRVAFVDLPTIRYEVGSADALSSLRVPMARHFVSMLTRAVTEDRIQTRISQNVIDEVVADAHRWLGEELVARGELQEGRQHLLRSLRINPRQPRVARIYGGAFLPAWLRERLVGAQRELTQRLA